MGAWKEREEIRWKSTKWTQTFDELKLQWWKVARFCFIVAADDCLPVGPDDYYDFSFIVIIISWLSRFVNTLIRVFSNYFIDGIQSIHWTVRGSNCMQIWWIETNSLQFCHWYCIGRISELRESKKCNLPRHEAMSHTVGASSRKKQMDNAAHNNTIFYNKLRQWRVERRNTRGEGKQLLDKYDNFLWKENAHFPSHYHF